MKVQSWSTLLATLLFGGVGLFYTVLRAVRGKAFDVVWVVLLVILIAQGLAVSFSETRYRAEQKRNAKSKKLYRRLFGAWAPVMPWGSLLLLFMGLIASKLLPDLIWPGMAFVIAAALYGLWLITVLIRHQDDVPETTE